MIRSSHERSAGFRAVFSQVKILLRTVSVAVRAPDRELSREHGHIADSVTAPNAI
jgi:hypothetical protein